MFKCMLFFAFLFLSLTACVTDSGSNGFYDSWVLEKIIYDDNSINRMEKGSFVQIHKGYIVEIIKGHGTRRYSYLKQKEMLSLMSGNDIITWEIIIHEENELQIKTPIGLYVLTR